MHLSRLWTDTQVRKATVVKMSKTEPGLVEIQVHLSRLWTDTRDKKKSESDEVNDKNVHR